MYKSAEWQKYNVNTEEVAAINKQQNFNHMLLVSELRGHLHINFGCVNLLKNHFVIKVFYFFLNNLRNLQNYHNPYTAVLSIQHKNL